MTKKPMKVTFLGTGTSMGVPVAGGFGRENPSSDPRDERWRTSAWLQTDEASIIIDIGPEFRLQTLRSGIKRVDMVLVTHEHTDHIGGLDDLRPFNYVQKQSIPLHTTPSCEASIRRRFEYMFGPNRTPGSVEVEIQSSPDSFVFKDCKITPLPVKHGKLDVYGFRVNDFAYITDTNFVPDSTIALINDCKVLVLNALRWSPDHPTHFTIPEAVDFAKSTGIPKIYFVHMSSHVYHAPTNEKLPKGMMLAYDQQQILI